MPAQKNQTGQSAKPFSVVIAYDETEARLTAVHVYPHLMEERGWDRESECLWWSFSELSQPAEAHLAAQAAKRADMIVIATKSQHQLTAELQSWIQRWLPAHQGSSLVLVGLVVNPMGERPHTDSLQRSLQQLARNSRITFQAYQWQAPASSADYSLEALLERSETVTHLLEEILEHAHSPHGREIS